MSLSAIVTRRELTADKPITQKEFDALTKLEEVVLHDGYSETAICIDDNVFVVPNPDEVGQGVYWQASVSDIRLLPGEQDKENTVYVKLHWFLTAEDVAVLTEKIPVSKIGPTERIKSNWSDIADCLVIEAKSDIKHFDDSLVNVPPMDNDDYYYRWTVSVSGTKKRTAKIVPPVPKRGCVDGCHDVYDPHIDMQRYCMSCHRWYHVSCLEARMGPAPPYTINGAPLPARVKTSNINGFMRVCREPIERGGNAGVAGNGEFILRAHDMLYADSIGSDWMAVLGEQNVLNVLRVTKPSLFQCPKCKHMYI